MPGGLGPLPEGGEQRDAMAARLHEALGHGYAPSTRFADEGYCTARLSSV